MADNGTPVAELTKRFAQAASKPGDPRSEDKSQMMTSRAKERATGAADGNQQNDAFHGRKGRRVATY